MQCPNDQTTLAMMDRQGIEIDYCPTCRGVWLDRGELDKLINTNQDQQSYQAPARPQFNEPQQYQQPRRDYSEDHNYKNKHRKKESFLGDLFDF